MAHIHKVYTSKAKAAVLLKANFLVIKTKIKILTMGQYFLVCLLSFLDWQDKALKELWKAYDYRSKPVPLKETPEYTKYRSIIKKVHIVNDSDSENDSSCDSYSSTSDYSASESQRKPQKRKRSLSPITTEHQFWDLSRLKYIRPIGSKMSEHNFFGSDTLEQVEEYITKSYLPVRVIWQGDYDVRKSCFNYANKYAKKNTLYNVCINGISKVESSAPKKLSLVQRELAVLKESLRKGDIKKSKHLVEEMDRICASPKHKYLLNQSLKRYIDLESLEKNARAIAEKDYIERATNRGKKNLEKIEENAKMFAKNVLIYHPLPLLTASSNGGGGGDYTGSYALGGWTGDIINFSNTEPPSDFTAEEIKDAADFIYDDYVYEDNSEENGTDYEADSETDSDIEESKKIIGDEENRQGNEFFTVIKG